MSNAKHSNTPVSSTSSTPAAASTAPASSPAKPTIAGGEVKTSVGNGSPATPDTPPSAQTDGQTAADASAAPDSESDPLMFCVVVGTVRQFRTAAKAEEYLNGPDAPPPDGYTVIRGRVATTKRKISLRG